MYTTGDKLLNVMKEEEIGIAELARISGVPERTILDIMAGVMVKRYNDIYRVQMPNITPHICRHTYCSNMAKSGMNPKTLQYLMGHSDIGVTLNTYTHLGLEDAEDELKRLEDLKNARKELERTQGEKPVPQKIFKAI